MKINNLSTLDIEYNGHIYHGADQDWYTRANRRFSGCGPTTCSNMLWFYMKNQVIPVPENVQLNGKNDMVRLMDSVWDYVTPGHMGVNRTGIMVDGISRYADDHGFRVNVSVLDIPTRPGKNPENEVVKEFIYSSIDKDIPVPFLNLSNGSINQLENWHWVLIVGIDGNKVFIVDNGLYLTIDLYEWLDSTLLGGGFISAEPVG